MDWKLEARIRERAYQIWEREGRPEGRDFDHWTRAVAEVQAEEEGGKAPAGAAAQASKKGASKEAAPKKAAAKKKVNGAGAAPKVAAGAIKKAVKPKGKGTSARS